MDDYLSYLLAYNLMENEETKQSICPSNPYLFFINNDHNIVDEYVQIDHLLQQCPLCKFHSFKNHFMSSIFYIYFSG